MIGKFIHLLNQSGADLDDRQIAEALWLSRHLTIREAAGTDEKKRKSDSEMSEKTPAAEQPAAQPQTTQPVPDEQPIFLAKQHESGGGVTVSKIRAPGVASLPAALMICRALRPFARRVESNRVETLDETATVQLSAEISGKDHPVLLPVMKPAKERWFEVAVVVEDTPTMAIWRPTIDELVLLLGRHGAFRDARLWLLRFGNQSARLVSTSGTEFDTMTLNDFCSRRLMILVSDCVSARWRDGSMANLIDEWAETMPVVIGHMLSKRLWRRTALGEPTSEVKAARPGATNKDLIIANVKWWDQIEENAEADEEDLERHAEPSRKNKRIACPVVSLDPKLISEWAKMVMSPGRRYLAALLSLDRKPSPVPQKDGPAVTPTAESLIERYRMMVSPEAFDLAVHLSFMPLVLPVMRVIQRAMIPNPRQEQLAEFLMGGLLKRKDPDAEHTDRESIQYEFHDGVRELLRSEIRHYEVAPVLHCVSEFVGWSINSIHDFIAWAQDPRGADQAQLSGLPFAQIGLDGLEQLGYPRYAVSHDRISVDETTSVSEYESATSSQTYSQNIDAPQERPFVAKERGKELIGYALRAVTEVQSDPPEAGRSGQLGIFSLPFPRNKFFIGRDGILKDIHKNFKAGKMVQALSGFGGVGKTQIALEYAYRYQKNYQVVLWGNAHSRRLLVSDFLAMAGLLKLPEIHVQDQVETINAVKRWFENNDGWLLILDSADDLAIAREFIPSREIGHVLLTTRAQNTEPIAARQVAEGMGPQEGALFLLRRLRIIKEDESLESAPEEFRNQAEALSKAMNDLPLALDQAAAFIEETPSSIKEYRELYRAERLKLLNARGEFAEGHPESVAVTFSLAFKKVEKANPAAADLLRVAAFLEADSIPEEIFSEGAKELGEALASAAESPLALTDAIEETARLSLLQRHPEARTLSLHRLAQAVLRDEMDGDTRRVWAERAVRAVNKVFPASEYSNWQACSRLIHHAQSLARSIDEFRFEFPEAARMLNQAGEYLNERAQYADAGPLFRRALAIREKVFGIEHVSVASSLNNLAGLYYNIGKYTEAESIWNRALTITENAFGNEDMRVATMLNNLAELYTKQGRYVQAEPLYDQSLAIYRKTLGDEHPSVAVSFNNLAELYLQQGKYAEAEPLLKRALDIKEKLLGAEHPDAATSLNAIAVLYYSLGRYAEAEPLSKRALDIREKAFGSTHPEVANSLNNLAELYRKQGNYADAESLDQRALDIREKALSADHPDVATSLNNLALSYSSKRMYAEAESLHRRAIDIREKAFGPEHPEVANSLENLAGLYFNQGKHAEAEPLLKRALDIREKALGPEHPYTSTSLNNLVELYRAQARYAEAEQLCRQALAVSEKALGAEHPSVAASLNNIAGLYNSQGKYEEAEPLHRRALAIRERVFGAEHPDVANSLNNLALLYYNQGKYEEVEPLYRRALAIREKAFGPEHPDVAASLNNLAALYYSQGKYEEAEPLYQRALAIRERVFGAEHPDVANSLNNLAALYYNQGRYEEVEPLYRRALAISEKALGPEHPDVANSLNNLAALYYKQGRYEETESLFVRALAIREKAFGPEHPDVAAILENYSLFLRATDKESEAEKLENRASIIKAGRTRGINAENALAARNKSTLTEEVKEMEYDVAISFAGEQRKEARDIAEGLKRAGVKVFFDEYEDAELWGKNLYEHLSEVYKDRAQYCIILVSAAYAKKVWTSHERRSAQARALQESQEYILPVRIDDTELPGLLPTVTYLDFNRYGADGICRAFLRKIGRGNSVSEMSPELKITTSSLALIREADSKIYRFIPVLNSKWGSSRAVLTLGADDPEDGAFLDGLQTRARMTVAYGNHVAICKVMDITHNKDAGASRWELTLHPQSSEFGPAFELGGLGTTSKDEYAQKRVRRLLLNEELPGELDDLNQMMEEIFIRGQDDTIEILGSPFPRLYREYGKEPKEFLEIAWVTGVYLLRTSGTVAEIPRFELTLTGQSLAVDFVGKRKMEFSNRPAYEIKVQGTCDLSRQE
jgi:tetratricopeptide (TPR) repeat protein